MNQPSPRKRTRRRETSYRNKKFAKNLRHSPDQGRIILNDSQGDVSTATSADTSAPPRDTPPSDHIPSSPPGLAPPNATAPWCGDVAGFTWNANGLVTLDEKAKVGKAELVLALLQKKDFGVITDTHSIEERSLWYDQFFETHGFKIFWSHKVYRNGGVAIIVRRSFLAQFSCHHRFIVRQGQCIALRLRMANGKGLDIFGCYFPAAGAYLRRQLMDKLCENINSKAHNMVLGDFNFTNRAGDRYYFSTEGSSWATTADAENAHWDSNFQGNKRLTEIHQPRCSYQCTRWCSRIDRVYSSLPHSRLDALDYQARIHDEVAWSDHKPLSFFIKTKATCGNYGHGGLAAWTFANPQFPTEVETLFAPASRERNDDSPVQALNRLLWAINTAARTLDHTHESYVAKSDADKFYVARALLIAYRNKNEHKCRALLHAVPHIQLDIKHFPAEGEDVIFHELDQTYTEKAEEGRGQPSKEPPQARKRDR